jgi:hypothetical protein
LRAVDIENVRVVVFTTVATGTAAVMRLVIREPTIMFEVPEVVVMVVDVSRILFAVFDELEVVLVMLVTPKGHAAKKTSVLEKPPHEKSLANSK